MALKEKLKELRTARGMTQEAVAERLGVSSQTVSKWERGLLSPDISLLPRIAVLYHCSIDSIFDMDRVWSIEHEKEFKETIRQLHRQRDWEGVYNAWIYEIELNPDRFDYYPDIMLHVYRKKLFEEDRVQKMLSLADHAEKTCMDDDKRNEIYRTMIQLCAAAGKKEKARYYYKKLPMLRHSREFYSFHVMDQEEHRHQCKKNLIYLVNCAEFSIRHQITPDMPPEEQLYYYKKAAEVVDVVLDGRYGGVYDPLLLNNYRCMATLYMELGKPEEARVYLFKIITAIEKHLSEEERQCPSKLLYATYLKNSVPTETIVKQLLRDILERPEFMPFYPAFSDLLAKYVKRFPDE